jgi:hypothetical protein|nr:Unknown Function [uncultured bacterium]
MLITSANANIAFFISLFFIVLPCYLKNFCFLDASLRDLVAKKRKISYFCKQIKEKETE